MKTQKPEIIYSEPVREIMGKPPGWILRWGNVLMLVIFILFILFSWLIKYPDTIPSAIEITTANPPVMLVSKITGNINSLFVKDKDQVKAGQLLAVMETTASLKDIELLRQTIDTVTIPELLNNKSLPMFSQLGEIEVYYAAFQRDLTDLNNYISNDFYGSKIRSLSEGIRGTEEYISRLKVKEKLFSENQKIEAGKFSRDSTLFAGNVIAEIDKERSHQSLLKVNIELQQVRLDYSAKTVELAEKKQLLDDFRIARVQEKEKLISSLHESFLNLRAQADQWSNTYLLVSPVEGNVSFTRFWTSNQSVTKDEPVMSVVPLDPGNFLGRINLKMQRSGKVKTGQLVNIKLSGYPYMEYGMVRGIIKSKSLVPAGDSYVIEIELPDGLTTLYGDKLEFNQNMQGTAEIITESTRLLQKIINPFRYAISRNRNQ